MSEDWVRNFIPNYDNEPGRGYLTSLADPDTKLAPKTANFLSKMFYHNCARPWYLYVETFVPAFLELAFVLGTLDLEDLIRDRARDVASQGLGQARRSSHRPGRKRPVRRPPVTRYVAPGLLKTLLVVTAPLELIGFAFLLYSATDRFYGNWLSLIEQADFCTQPIESGPFERKAVQSNWFLNEAEFVATMGILVQNRGGWINNAFHVEVPHGFYTAVFAAKIRAVGGDIPGVYIALRAPVAIGTKTFKSETATIKKDEDTDFIVEVSAFQGSLSSRSLTWHTGGATVPAGCIATSAEVFVTRTG